MLTPLFATQEGQSTVCSEIGCGGEFSVHVLIRSCNGVATIQIL